VASQASLDELTPRSRRSRERILAAARACFERLGIEAATIVDIAEAANYSRPIVYKHFSDKADIVDSVCLEEMQTLRAELRKRVKPDLSYDAQLTESILQAVILANDNPYIRRFMEDRESWLRSQTIGRKVRDWVRASWEAFIRRGQAAGAFARDLDLEETVTWIAMNQSQLLLRYQDEGFDEASMRRFIRRFVVTPLLA